MTLIQMKYVAAASKQDPVRCFSPVLWVAVLYNLEIRWMHVEALTLFPCAPLQPSLVVSPSSRSAASAARPRVRLMRRLPWWASMTAIRPCHFASALSWAITAALLRANRPATRSEFLFPSPYYSFVAAFRLQANLILNQIPFLNSIF